MRSIAYFLYFLTVIAVIASFLILPYFYNYRLSTGIFRNDFYLIWFTGCFCWLAYLLFSPIHFATIGIICVSGCSYVLLSCFFNSSLDESSFYTFINLLSFVGITLYLQTILSGKLFSIVLTAIIFSYLTQVVIGISQALENNWQSLSIKGQLHNSGFYGNYLASMMPFLFSTTLNKSASKLNFRLIALTLFVTVGLLLCLTLARAAIIGTLIGSLVVFLYQFNFKRQSRVFASIILIMLVPLIAIASYKIKPASASGRLTIYEISLNIFKEHPFFGIGPNRFSAVYNNYQSEYFQAGDKPLYEQLLAENTLEAFNSLLQILVEYGIVGFLILAGFIYQLIRTQKRHKQTIEKIWLHAGSIGSIVAIVVCSLFSNPFHVTPILVTLAFHFAVILPKKVELKATKSTHSSLLLFYSFIALGIFYFVLLNYKAEKAWEKASNAAKYDSFPLAKKYYEEAFLTLKHNGDFLFNYGAEACLAGEYHLAAKLLESAKNYSSHSNLFIYLGDTYSGLNDFSRAEQNYLQAVYIAPSHIYPKYQLIQLYKRWNKQDLAKKWTFKTLQMPVKIKSEITYELLNELWLEIKK